MNQEPDIQQSKVNSKKAEELASSVNYKGIRFAAALNKDVSRESAIEDVASYLQYVEDGREGGKITEESPAKD